MIPVKMYLSDINTLAVNLAGLPGMSIGPVLPMGCRWACRLIGNYFDEGRLLNVAHQYQQHTDWHRPGTGGAGMSQGPWESCDRAGDSCPARHQEQDFLRRPPLWQRAQYPGLCGGSGPAGVLPVLNREAVRMAAMFGLAVGATVSPRSVFARKNYFLSRSAQGLSDQPV
jgi:hypothetical protein